MKKILGLLAIIVIVFGLYFYFSNNQSSINSTENTTFDNSTSTQEITESATNQKTVENNKKITVSTSKPAQDTKAEPQQTPTQKNIYRHSSAGYSIEIPTGWTGEIVDTGNPLIFDTTFIDPSGKIARNEIGFSVTATSRKFQNDQYAQAYGKVPTNKDLLDMFIATQKDTIDTWSLTNQSTTNINGITGYSMTATYSDGYVTSNDYLLFGSNYIYLVSVDLPTSELDSVYPKYKMYMQTFSAK